jgi:glycosyltransferase involved in cell wall biosynthesis
MKKRSGKLSVGTEITRNPIGSQPLVSIIIPYHKQEKYVAETVLSAKRQTHPNIEIIVVDDGSPVSVEPLLKGFDGIQLLRTTNQGVSAARNLGFHRSSGEYLIFLDSDDVLSPGAVEAHLKVLLAYPAAGLSFGAIRMIDENGGQIRPAHICRPRKNYFLMLLEGNPIGCPGSVMVRREAFIAAGLFDESFRIVEDYLLYLRVARQRPLARLSFCVADYRQHGASISQSKDKMFLTTMAVLDRIENSLTETERRRLDRGRRRWEHEFRREDTLTYRAWSLYYSFRAMLGVPLRSYFGLER